MRITKTILICLCLMFFSVNAFALISIVCEEDGDPCTYPYLIKVANDNLTDNGDGTASIADQTAVGSGDAVTVNGSAVDTTANFKDNTAIAFTITDGGAGGPDDVKADLIDDSVGPTELADTDFGDFTCADAGGGCTLDANTVDTNELADATLDALSAYNTNGLITQTAADTFTGRTITGTANEITVTNGDGVAGNPTLSLPNNAGTDITADLEEETHASEHLADAADEIFMENLGTACAITQIAVSDGDGTVSCSNQASGSGSTEIVLLPAQAHTYGAFVTHTPAGCSTTPSISAYIDRSGGPEKLIFDDGSSSDNAAVWQFKVPDNWSSWGNGYVDFSMATGEANEVEFELSVMCYTPTTDTADVDSPSFANCVVPVTPTTVSATAGEVYRQTIAITDDSCAAGDDAWVWLSTDADDGTNDGATGLREVISLTLDYS